MVRIASASINENGKATGGKDGDQTGKEVLIRGWYNGGWTCLLRPISSELAEKSAFCAESISNNSKVGYDQNKRNSLHTQLIRNNYDLTKITSPCSVDCSSFMTACAIYGGANGLEYKGNAPTTSTMISTFVNSGYYIAIYVEKYLTASEYLERGDILVKAGKHTVIVLDNGVKSNVSRETNENGTGDIILNVRELSQGCHGADVRAIQCILNNAGYNTNGIDGIFGSATKTAVKTFQKAKTLGVDGVVGKNTWGALING